MSDFSDISFPAQVNDNNKVMQPDDNVVQGFRLESSGFRGRSVRLGDVLDQVLSAHDYPYPVAHLVAETMVLTALLSSMLKYDGIFTLQAKGDGPISMLVADMTSSGDLRACATFDDERLQHAREQLAALKTPEGSQNHLAQYLGKGYMAFTVDQGGHTDRYQGIVELKGASLVDCAQHYFTQSEQIATGIKMAAGIRDGVWRAGGIMLQQVPDDGGVANQKTSNLDEDEWRRSMVYLESCKDDEILDKDLHSHELLHRLFHEDGVRVYEPLSLQHKCRCSVDRVKNVLSTMSSDDIVEMTVNGKISMTCEFCSSEYDFDPKTLEVI